MQQMTMFGLNQPKKEEKKVNYKEFTYASAFAGIGGMTMGLQDLGGKGVIAWEYDPSSKKQYAQDAHKLLHPNIPVDGDICAVDTNKLVDFDVLCFTPPCQSFSVAGKRGGFEDTRGTLTFEALRIAKVKQPKVLFMENVKGLVNHDKGNTMSVIINAINDIGYTVDFNVLNSKYFGVAQNRERVYLIAVRNDLITPEPWENINGSPIILKAKNKYMEQGAVTLNFDWPEQNKVNTVLKDFLESEVEEKYYIDEIKTLNLIKELENSKIAINKEKQNMIGHVDLNGHDICKRVYSAEGQCNTIPTGSSGNTTPKIAEEVFPCLTPFRENKRQNGPRFKSDGLESHTITTVDRHGVAIGKYPKYRIRKLTPRECLRLQSVPEDKIDLLLENFSDSRCYKFAGNGLTTNVIKAIGEKLLKYL